MPDDGVEKFLADQKTLEAHRHDLIKELLRQKEAAIKAFDEKLAKLGYDGANSPGAATTRPKSPSHNLACPSPTDTRRREPSDQSACRCRHVLKRTVHRCLRGVAQRCP